MKKYTAIMKTCPSLMPLSMPTNSRSGPRTIPEYRNHAPIRAHAVYSQIIRADHEINMDYGIIYSSLTCLPHGHVIAARQNLLEAHAQGAMAARVLIK